MAKKSNVSMIIKNADVTPVHVTVNHTGKMFDMLSISTPCCDNARCMANAQIPGSICAACYAKRQLSYQASLRDALHVNFEILTARILSDDEIPVIDPVLRPYGRIESFGDVCNVIQAINYINIIRKNPGVHFGVWSKNPDLYHKAFQQLKIDKPANMIFVLSSLFENQAREIPAKYAYFVDKVFTVYTKKYLADHPEIVINCGARCCRTCLNCYHNNGIVYINEIKK